ncbi:fumarylacetoacetate hydrolase family protein [Arthrobacter sp. zg-Y750]|uniref:fumarylacetoacetate hydrolase family protein n=1 Tax=Arthrobacter sp. zg-Y750 TaxID=2894189 RepID=UPI001E434F5D|nr:fumarylacetoacetate hydrolase family protein [Arthrobacter sp. zg-Y750]MCC9176706.1 fumarylacetoacetate hydrolase family protein [Arthrobacter sp. zg-Y750]
MKLATIAAGGGTSAAVVLPDGSYLPLDAPNLSALLQQDQWREEATRQAAAPDAVARSVPREGTTLLNPLPAPAKVICCGLNYSEHILEMGRELPRFPTLFAKFADTLTDPFADLDISGSESVDWEGELAVVVGTALRHADEAEAAAGIAGYTAANDISMRDWQNRTLQWFQGKAFDRSTPLGPVLVTADELDPEAGVEVSCYLNGERMQHGNTASLVFSAARLLSYISTFTELRPGDIVLTGTPGGVGMGMNPPRYLSDGDVLTTEVGGIGRLENHIRVSSRVTA